MVLLILSNANSGGGEAQSLIDNYVLPLLRNAQIEFSLHHTSSAEEATALAKDHIEASVNIASILLAGGDGTVNELVNFVARSPPHNVKIEFVLLPTGTANALFSSFYPPSNEPIFHPYLSSDADPAVAHKLQSVLAFVGQGTTLPLTIASTSVFELHASSPISTTLSIVVNSTSLHAAILDTAEKYRDTIPGIERFKVAAAENITNWGKAQVELLPAIGSDAVKLYDPVKAAFVEVENVPILEGPFFYFLSTVNVDRLEPEFVTTPLVKRFPSVGDALDLIIVRPLRNPAFVSGSETPPADFVPLAMEWFNAIYRGGKHIDLKYENIGDPVYVTEYYRVGGWKWTPKDDTLYSRLVCVDGTILQIPVHGHVVVRADDERVRDEIRVWV